MTQTILESVQIHWQDLRGRTYDLMDVLADADLNALSRIPEHSLSVLLYVGHSGKLAARAAGRRDAGLGLQSATCACRRSASG